jgi:hypothetical protein
MPEVPSAFCRELLTLNTWLRKLGSWSYLLSPSLIAMDFMALFASIKQLKSKAYELSSEVI